MSKKISLKTIAGSLKFIIIAMGLCAFAIQSVISLMLIISDADNIDKLRAPWMVFLWSTAIPMIPALIYSWKTASNIGRNKPFCLDNSKNLKPPVRSSLLMHNCSYRHSYFYCGDGAFTAHSQRRRIAGRKRAYDMR